MKGKWQNLNLTLDDLLIDVSIRIFAIILVVFKSSLNCIVFFRMVPSPTSYPGTFRENVWLGATNIFEGLQNSKQNSGQENKNNFILYLLNDNLYLFHTNFARSNINKFT